MNAGRLKQSGLWGGFLLVLMLAGGPSAFGQMDYGINQVPYLRGQNVVPTFEGWERNPDGSFNMVFGYLNRNYEEEVDIPIGPDNNIEPGGPDQGQPTAFGTRRHQFQFRVKVPKDWEKTKRLVWTLTVRGKTEKANAFLLPEWEINEQVIAGRFGGSGGAPDPGENKAPTLAVGADQAIALPSSATLTVSVSDDGLPKPRPRPVPARPAAGAAATGAAATPPAAAPPPPPSLLRVEWVVWRRPAGAKVTFEPATGPVVGGKAAAQSRPAPDPKAAAAEMSKPDPVTDGKASTKATFSAPGTYVVKAFAFDGNLSGDSSLMKVTVTGSAADSP